ncbi:FAD binding domain-containing protein [Nemania sp. NC0429]|nr:FAD binding domain-containing protein [Nemania sp. NC0429]
MEGPKTFSKPVIVIGGSVSGLLQGLQMKRNGRDVIVLEQDPSESRHNHESGVSIGPTVVKLLEKYDATGRPAAIPSRFLSVAWLKRLRVLNMVWKHNMSNWGCLYLILRANYDGLPSEVVPDPPRPKPTDGAVEYHPGKRVVDVGYDQDKGLVHVHFVDSVTGEKGSLSSELVIAADGVHSTVRKLLGVPTRRQYAGYIGWRGTVPERLLSPSTIEYFSNRLNFSILGGMYFISYFIPTETGHTEPGERLINWVWYYPVPEDSAEMAAMFTDTNGKLHPSTVPQGLVNPNVWAAQVARYIGNMTAPLGEVVSKTPAPFITKVSEAQCGAASFYGGRLVLVGDAFTGYRSHLGMASEQAARHCVALEKVLRGEMTQEQYHKEVVFYSQRFILLNRFIGLMGMGWIRALLSTMFAYAWLMITHTLGLATIKPNTSKYA